MSIEIIRVGELTGGTGTTLAVGPDGTTTIAAGTRRAYVGAGKDLAHTIALPGYDGGAITFSNDGRTARIGDRSIDTESGGITSGPVSIDLLTSGLEFEERAPARFSTPGPAAAAPDGGRLVAMFSFAPSRG